MRSYSIFGIIAVARSRLLTACRPHWPSIAVPRALRSSVVISRASGMRRCEARNPFAPRSPTAFRIFSAKTGVYSTQWPSPSMTGCDSFERICSGLACALMMSSRDGLPPFELARCQTYARPVAKSNRRPAPTAQLNSREPFAFRTLRLWAVFRIRKTADTAWRVSGAFDAPEGGEASRDDAGQILAMGRGLPVFAHRDEGQVLPNLQLHLAGETPLLVGIGGIEPGGAQFLDPGAGRPAVPAGLAVGPHRLVAERVGVRDRAVDHREEHVPAALVGRALVGAAPDHGAEIHLLEIDVEAGAAQLLGADLREIADAGHFGRRDDHDLLALVAGLGERLLRGRVVARSAQPLDPGLVGERRSGGEDADAVKPVGRLLTGDRDHRLRLVDRRPHCAARRAVLSAVEQT